MSDSPESRLVEAQTAAANAARALSLWQLPIIDDLQAAEVLGISRSNLAGLKRARKLPEAFRIGRRTFIKTSDLRAWIDQRANDAA